MNDYKEKMQTALLNIQSKVSDKAKLIAVSKGQTVNKIADAINLGVENFGENKLQEATLKWGELKAIYPKVKLHMIGGIQSNKVQEIVELFDFIHSIDREKIIDAVALANNKLRTICLRTIK